MEQQSRLTPGSIILLLVVGLFLAFFLLLPVARSTYSAFIHDGKPSLSIARAAIGNPLYKDSILNSFKISIATTLLTLLLSLPPAYLMARVRLPGKSILSALLMVPLILPPFVGAIGIRQILSEYGTVNSLLNDRYHLISENIPW